MAKKVLRRPAVQARVGLCRSGLYARIAAGEFPKPIQLGPRSVAAENEVDDWIEARAAERDDPQDAAK